MIVYTSWGLLYTTADRDSLEALLSMPLCYFQVWYCPTGVVRPEWIENRTRIERLLDEYVWDDFIGDWNPARQGPLVLPKHCEEVLRRELGNRLIGPIDEVPGPSANVRASLNSWFTYVMYGLTKHGDEIDDLWADVEEVEPGAGMSPQTSGQLSIAEDQLAIKFPRRTS